MNLGCGWPVKIAYPIRSNYTYLFSFFHAVRRGGGQCGAILKFLERLGPEPADKVDLWEGTVLMGTLTGIFTVMLDQKC